MTPGFVLVLVLLVSAQQAQARARLVACVEARWLAVIMDSLSSHTLVMSDLEHGNGKWRNISPAIRFTLRALLHTVERQHARILALESAIVDKADTSDVRCAALSPLSLRGCFCFLALALIESCNSPLLLLAVGALGCNCTHDQVRGRGDWGGAPPVL